MFNLKIIKIMKRIIFLLVGALIFNFACQKESFESEYDEFIDSKNDMTFESQKAKNEKTKTFHIKGSITATPNNDGLQIACVPVESGVLLVQSGWVSGHENIFGKIDSENSTYDKEFCEFGLTPDGPEVYNITNVILQRMNGEQMFVKNYMWINLINGEISGYSDVMGGTGRFEGASGSADMLNGTVDLITGIGNWEEDGYITLILKNIKNIIFVG